MWRPPTETTCICICDGLWLLTLSLQHVFSLVFVIELLHDPVERKAHHLCISDLPGFWIVHSLIHISQYSIISISRSNFSSAPKQMKLLHGHISWHLGHCCLFTGHGNINTKSPHVTDMATKTWNLSFGLGCTLPERLHYHLRWCSMKVTVQHEKVS